jgi:hypothetical protein
MCGSEMEGASHAPTVSCFTTCPDWPGDADRPGRFSYFFLSGFFVCFFISFSPSM